MIRDRFIRQQVGADALREGFFLLRRDRAGRVPLPIRIEFSQPRDEDGEPLDRSPRWQVTVAGFLLDDEPIHQDGVHVDSLADIWPVCSAHEIDEAEYDFLIKRADWSAMYDPNDPYGRPGGKIDPMTATLPFLD